MQNHYGKILNKKNNYKIIDCRTCKFIHILPLPSEKKIINLYKKKYYTKIKPQYIKKYEREIDYWNLVFDEKLDYLETKIKRKTKSILDVGSGSGFFLKRAKERGWTVNGVEPNVFVAKYSEKIGVPVITDFFQNIDIKNMKKYEVINLFDVLEHVYNPTELLKKCHRLLKSGGIIVIEAPNDYNPLQKIVQKSLKKEEYWLTVLTKSRNYSWASKIDHVNYFNFSSLKRLLTNLRFKVIYQQSTFPLELFLLMGDDYLKSEKIGKKIHQKRINLEMNLMVDENRGIKKEIYEKFAEIGIGRTAIIYAKK